MASLAGAWAGTEHVEPSPWAAGGSSAVTLGLRGAVDGLVLVQDQHSAALSGHGVLSVDPATGEVLHHWWDAVGFPPLEPARGDWEGETLTVQRTSPRGTNPASWTREGPTLVTQVAFRAPGAAAFALVARAELRATSR